MNITNYNIEELEFLSDFLAFGAIDSTVDCLSYKTIGLGLCASCPRKRVCNDMREFMNEIDVRKRLIKNEG